MSRQTIIQSVLLCSLSFSPAWVMAEEAVTTMPLDISAKEGSVSERVADNGAARNPLATLRSEAASEGASVDCFYRDNAQESACRDDTSSAGN